MLIRRAVLTADWSTALSHSLSPEAVSSGINYKENEAENDIEDGKVFSSSGSSDKDIREGQIGQRSHYLSNCWNENSKCFGCYLVHVILLCKNMT